MLNVITLNDKQFSRIISDETDFRKQTYIPIISINFDVISVHQLVFATDIESLTPPANKNKTFKLVATTTHFVVRLKHHNFVVIVGIYLFRNEMHETKRIDNEITLLGLTAISNNHFND